MKKQLQKLLIAAAGTGGHIFPALAVADHLRNQGVAITWCGTPERMEAQLIPKRGYPIELINVKGLRGKNLLHLCKGLWLAASSIWQAWRMLGRVKPQLVLAMGGFVCGPVGLAAKLRGIPLVIHEQNSVAGMTNNLLSRIATKILIAFPNTFPKQYHPQLTGNPVRQDLLCLPSVHERFATRTGTLRMLVLGGSQGATIFNRLLPEALAILLQHGITVEVWHQTGAGAASSVSEAYAAAGIGAKVSEFIDDMAQAYAWADLLVGRSGALTVAEVATVGVPALFIPYPHAVDDHQYTNAKPLVEQGAAQLLRQENLTAAVLANNLVKLLQSRETLLMMAVAALAHSHHAATDLVASSCQEVVEYA